MTSSINARNGDLEITDIIGRKVRFHWSRSHGVIVLMDSQAACATGTPEDAAALAGWLAKVGLST